MPAAGEFTMTGVWDSALLLWLVILSIIAGLLIYWLGSFSKMRRADSFVGGEKAGQGQDFPVTTFYQTLTSAPLLSTIYQWAEKKYFDIYDLTKSMVLYFNKVFSKNHSGVLTRYAFWIYGGFLIMLLIMIL